MNTIEINGTSGWVCVNCKRCLAPFMPYCDCTEKKDLNGMQLTCSTCGVKWNSKDYPMGHVCRQLL
jgi:hypothetical protein